MIISANPNKAMLSVFTATVNGSEIKKTLITRITMMLLNQFPAIVSLFTDMLWGDLKTSRSSATVEKLRSQEKFRARIYHNCYFRVCGVVFFVFSTCFFWVSDLGGRQIQNEKICKYLFCSFRTEVTLHMIKFNCCFFAERKRNIKSIIPLCKGNEQQWTECAIILAKKKSQCEKKSEMFELGKRIKKGCKWVFVLLQTISLQYSVGLL